MRYSVIIPSKDRPDLLQRVTRSLWMSQDAANDPPYELIVVETGDTVISRVDGPDCQIIHLPGATFAQANNAAVKMAHSKRLLLCNNDVIFQSDILQAFDIASLHHPDRIIGAHLVYPDSLTQHAGIGFDNEGNPYNLWRLAPRLHPEVQQRRRLPAVTFACAMIPRIIWEELGGLDEGYTNAYEDVDFCLRATEAGYSVMYDPMVSATHLEAQTAGRHDHDAESMKHFRQKWLANGRLFKALGMWPFSIGGPG